jgi:N-methylhydantoinase A/acetophenone carboxylase
VETPVYRFEDMQPGHRLEGPVLVEAEFTTLVIPPGQVFHIDSRGLGILEYLAPAA